MSSKQTGKCHFYDIHSGSFASRISLVLSRGLQITTVQFCDSSNAFLLLRVKHTHTHMHAFIYFICSWMLVCSFPFQSNGQTTYQLQYQRSFLFFFDEKNSLASVNKKRKTFHLLRYLPINNGISPSSIFEGSNGFGWLKS